jgi:ClpP class serine protease
MMKKLIKFVPHKGTRTRLQKWAGEGPPVVAVLRLDGVIGAVSNFRSGLSISDLAEPIEEAFKMKKAKAVALVLIPLAAHRFNHRSSSSAFGPWQLKKDCRSLPL